MGIAVELQALPQDMSHLLAERDNAWLLAADRAVVASPERCVNNTAFPGLQEAVH